jgi:hypothetical protein
MSLQNIYFEPVGKCIYCDIGPTKADKLTKEHIIPLALNGNHILPFSSCKKCASYTGATVEGQVLGQFLKNARVVAKLNSRRPQPKDIKLEILINNKYETRSVPVNLAKGMLMLPVFAKSGIQQGQIVEDTVIKGFDFIHIQNQPNEFYIKNNVTGMRETNRLKPSFYMQMLAKIGLGFYVSQKNALPPDGGELIRNLIFGRETNYSTYIGNADDIECQRMADSNHSFNVIDHIVNSQIVGSGVVIQLFSKFNDIINSKNCKYYIHIWGDYHN